MSSPKTGTRAGMARTDDDSWDITESVGQTALGVAWSRSLEAESDHPLFTDPYAQPFVDAAMARTRRQPPKYVLDRLRAIAGCAASRTKWFYERLPWLDGTVLYEIDQPKVLAFKSETLARHDAKPSVSRYVAVPADLRHDWPKALREAGFDARARRHRRPSHRVHRGPSGLLVTPTAGTPPSPSRSPLHHEAPQPVRRLWAPTAPHSGRLVPSGHGKPTRTTTLRRRPTRRRLR